MKKYLSLALSLLLMLGLLTSTFTFSAVADFTSAIMQNFEDIDDLKTDLAATLWTSDYGKTVLVNNTTEGLLGAEGTQSIKLVNSGWHSTVIYNGGAGDITKGDSIAMYLKLTSNEYNLLDLMVGESWNSDYNEARNQWKLKDQFTVTYYFMDGSKYTKIFGAGDTKIRAIDNTGANASSFEGYISVALDQFIPAAEYKNIDPLKLASVSLAANASTDVYVDNVQSVKASAFDPYAETTATTTTTVGESTTTTAGESTTTTTEASTTTTTAPVQKDEALMQDFEGITDLKKELSAYFWTQSWKKVALVNNVDEGLKGAEGSQALKMFDNNWNPVVIYNATGVGTSAVDAVAMYVNFSSNEYNLFDLVIGETWNDEYKEARNQFILKSGFKVTYYFLDGSKYTKTFGADDTKLRAIDKNGNDAASFEGYIMVALDQFVPAREYENTAPVNLGSVSLGVNGSNIVYVDDVKGVKMESFLPYKVQDDNKDDVKIPETGYTSYVLLAIALCAAGLATLIVTKKQTA